jgi:MFS transporter, putative metabolite:H+ symporter
MDEGMTTILARLDSLPLTAIHLIAAIACAAGLGADLMEISIGSALSAVFSTAPYSMSPERLSWLLSAVFVGAVIGAPLLGRLADRRGLKPVLAFALLWLCFTSLLAAASADTNRLIVIRFLSGLSLGALPPLIIAYLTGIAPPRFRGTYIFGACGLAFLAAPAAVFSIRWLTPLQPWGIEGWRWPFAAAALLSLGASAVLLYLPESPRWLVGASRTEAAELACRQFEGSLPVWGTAELFQTSRAAAPDNRTVPNCSTINSTMSIARRVVFITLLYFLQPWNSLGFNLLMGPILLARGYNLSNTLLIVGLASFGPSISSIFSSFYIDHTERKTALAVCAVLAFAAAVAFFSTSLPGWTMMAVVVYSIAQGMYLPLMITFGSEIFPTRVRASATSVAWAINRVGSVLVPAGVLAAFHRGGLHVAAVFIYIPLIASFFLVVTEGPRGLTRRGVA